MKFKLKGRMIFFATNNIHKFNEARRLLDGYKIAVGMLKAQKSEIQSKSLQEIAKAAVVEAVKRCHLPIIVEDAGLSIKALKEFPGPYSAYVYETIGNKGILKLMHKTKKREAKFKSVIAYHSRERKSPICFKGQTIGKITKKEKRGNNGSSFGFDPIFKPENSKKTFSEMTLTTKNRFSHRTQAMRKFAEWYEKKR